ncbi:MAG: carbohydrate kinase family protein [Spirochaetaceae bacterium]|nr:carbohydrate kinase family protein [Spirochaetaceae bacterium]
MNAIDYVVLSHVIVDDLRFPSGAERRGVLGGAGSYAAAGARLAADRVGIACGVGENFRASEHAAWFRANGIDTAGLEPRGPRTPRSAVVYHAEDARTETPLLGPAHFARMSPAIDRMPAAYRIATGYYLFRDHDAAFWDEAAALRASRRCGWDSGAVRSTPPACHSPAALPAASGAVVLWELHAASTEPACWPQVAARLACVDVVSLNLAEGRRLCGRDAPREIVRRLLDTGVGGVALRLGADGALLGRRSAKLLRIPAWPAAVVDVTGAGNAFGGALLAGLGAGQDWLESGCGAAAAASLMLEQHGPPEQLDHGEWRRRRDLLLARVRSATPAGATA